MKNVVGEDKNKKISGKGVSELDLTLAITLFVSSCIPQICGAKFKIFRL